MTDDNEVRIKDKHVWLAGAIFTLLMAVSFYTGTAYQKINSRFTWHEIPLKSGGIAFIVPKDWQVVTEWDEHGRPYIKTDH